MAGRIHYLTVNQHPIELRVGHADRFDQMLEGLVVFEVQAERDIFTIMGQEIVQLINEGESCFGQA
jgi:hypothetical protein